MFGSIRFNPLDRIIDAQLSRHCGKYIDTKVAEKVLEIVDKNGKSYDLYKYEDEKFLVFDVMDGSTIVGGLEYKRIQKECINKAYEITFGGFKASHRGLGLAQALTTGIFTSHTNYVDNNGPITNVYISLGRTSGFIMEYIGQKEYSSGNYRSWLCEYVDEVCDENEIVGEIDETRKKQLILEAKTGKRIFIGVK